MQTSNLPSILPKLFRRQLTVVGSDCPSKSGLGSISKSRRITALSLSVGPGSERGITSIYPRLANGSRRISDYCLREKGNYSRSIRSRNFGSLRKFVTPRSVPLPFGREFRARFQFISVLRLLPVSERLLFWVLEKFPERQVQDGDTSEAETQQTNSFWRLG
jgi:hypothetical protein